MEDSQITASDLTLAAELALSLRAMRAADAAGLIEEAGRLATRAATQIAELRAARDGLSYAATVSPFLFN